MEKYGKIENLYGINVRFIFSYEKGLKE